MPERRRRGEPVGEHPGPLETPGEVAVAEVEPDLDTQLAQGVHDRERVAGQPPAALVDQPRQPEADQVGVGGDVGAVDLDVIARIDDRRKALRAVGFGDPQRQLGAAGAAGQKDDVVRGGAQSHRPSGRPLRRMPAWIL